MKNKIRRTMFYSKVLKQNPLHLSKIIVNFPQVTILIFTYARFRHIALYFDVKYPSLRQKLYNIKQK